VSPFPDHKQLLLICLKLSDNEMGSEVDDEYVEELERQLISLTEELDFAHWDGHEYGGGYAKIFLYCTDVDLLYKASFKLLKHFQFTPASQIILQYGPPGSDQFVINPNKLPN
jgi:hypothetical protein